MRIFGLFLIVSLLTGCATYDVNQMRQSRNDNLTEVFDRSKQEVYEAVKSSIQGTDLIIRKENFEKGELLATPNRWRAFGKRLGSSVLSPLASSSYIGVYCYLTSQDDKKTKLEIVQVYDNPVNVGRDYKAGLMQGVKEVLRESSK